MLSDDELNIASEQLSDGTVTKLLIRADQGDSDAAERLLGLLYRDLRRVAASRSAGERDSHTLQPTDLVHEAYLRLVQDGRMPSWNSRRHFFSAAAEAMRRILIDHARARKATKRGGGHAHVECTLALVPDERSADRLLALDEALRKLEETDPSKAELVKLRFLAGLTIEQAAQALQISTTTADRYWAYARAKLKVFMQEESPGD